jgi:hypothetical protein
MASAASRLGLVPTFAPRTSLVEPPRTKRLPSGMGKSSRNSSMAFLACCRNPSMP